MWLKARILNVTVGGPFVVAVNTNDAAIIDVDALDRVKTSFHGKEVVAIVDLAYGFLQRGEVGLFLEVANALDVKENDLIDVVLEPKPISITHIRKKLDNKELTKEEIFGIVKDVVENKLSEIETAYFIAGCYTRGLSLAEVGFLTEGIVHFGGTLALKKKQIMDIHSIGGVPGNRVSMIVVPIVAAAGLTIPKTSTRSITSASGTSDVVELFAPVAHSKEKIEEIVRETNGCLVWGGTLDLASADDKLIKIERLLSLDPEGILLASIGAKKKAAGATHVLLEIPVGEETKARDARHAQHLAKKFKELGKRIGIEFEVIIVDGSQPVGNGIGPALEARDVLLVLEGRGPDDLRERSLMLAAQLMRMGSIENAVDKAKSILHSGLALEKFRAIIKAQGGNPNVRVEDLKIGRFTQDILATKNGKIVKFHNLLLARVARMAGAPNDKGAGIDVHVKLKSKVRKGEKLATIHAESNEKLAHALKIWEEQEVIIIK